MSSYQHCRQKANRDGQNPFCVSPVFSVVKKVNHERHGMFVADRWYSKCGAESGQGDTLSFDRAGRAIQSVKSFREPGGQQDRVFQAD